MNLILKKVAAISLAITLSTSLDASPFDSGSHGIDGELIIAEGLGDIIFDPDAFDQVLDTDRDGIYHFTRIEIGVGTRLHLRADVLGHKPVIWLVSGDVTIDGHISLSAQMIPNETGIPGAGGFSGGRYGGILDGQGPGGSPAAVPQVRASRDYVNPFLMPLVGGSGAGINPDDYSEPGSGGGALLLASSGTVLVQGEISAYGETLGGAGNVRIIANEIAGVGFIHGIDTLRLEAFRHNFTGNVHSTRLVRSPPGAVFPQSPITIVFVHGAGPLPQPGANKHTPDVTISNGAPTMIEVRCWQIPLGTRIRVVGWNETVGQIEALTGPLEGTLEESYAFCELIIPPGNTTFMAQAVLEP